MVSVERARDELRSMFWLVPAACVVTAIGLAVGLIAMDHALGAVSPGVLFPGPPSGARSFLSSITQAMIAFTGLVFSITIVVLQLTSGQFSPRVLRTFLRDRAIQLALGVFISTFVYAMVVQRAVTGSVGHHPFVPRIAVTGALVLVLASVGLFIFYIHHVANMVRVASIVASLGAESRDLLSSRYPAGQSAACPRPDLGPAARVMPRPVRGYWSRSTRRPWPAWPSGPAVWSCSPRGSVTTFPRELRCCVSIPAAAAAMRRASMSGVCWPRWPRTPNGAWNRIWPSVSASLWISPSEPCRPRSMIRRPPARPWTCSTICCAGWPPAFA